MNRAAMNLLAVAVMAVALSGCLSAGDVVLNRQFLVVPEITAAPAQATPNTLGVRPLTAARPYTLTMLYADADGALLPYSDVFWAELPAETVTRALRDALAATGRFADVGDAAEMSRPRFLLTGELRSFHEDRSGTPHVARIEVRLELREARADGQVWSGTTTASAALDGEGASAYAKAITKALEDLAMNAANAIAQVPLP